MVDFKFKFIIFNCKNNKFINKKKMISAIALSHFAGLIDSFHRLFFIIEIDLVNWNIITKAENQKSKFNFPTNLDVGKFNIEN